MSNSFVPCPEVSVEIEVVSDRTVHRQLAMQEALLQLGFEPMEILMAWNSGPRTLVKTKEKEFTISYPGATADSHHADEIDHFEEWLRESNRWYNEMTPGDRKTIYNRHVPEPVMQLLTGALKAKGFPLRNLEH